MERLSVGDLHEVVGWAEAPRARATPENVTRAGVEDLNIGDIFHSRDWLEKSVFHFNFNFPSIFVELYFA